MVEAAATRNSGNQKTDLHEPLLNEAQQPNPPSNHQIEAAGASNYS